MRHRRADCLHEVGRPATWPPARHDDCSEATRAPPCNSSSCESRATRKTGCARRWPRKVKIEGLEDHVGRILVPTERVRSMKGGERRDSDRKLYPGYVFIELELDKNGMIPEKVWFTIKETEGVGDFIGSNGKPTPMSPKDQAKMLEEAEKPDDATRPKPSSRRATRSRSPTARSRTSRARSTRSSPTRAWSGSSPRSSAARRRWSWSTGRSRRCERRRAGVKRKRASSAVRLRHHVSSRAMDRFGSITAASRGRGRIGGLPAWARRWSSLAALPGIVLVALSILAFLVSLLALLLLTVPVYRLLQARDRRRRRHARRPSASAIRPADGSTRRQPTGRRKRVEATVIEPRAGCRRAR